MRRTYPSDLLVVFVLTLVLLSLPTAIHFAFSDSFEPLDGPRRSGEPTFETSTETTMISAPEPWAW